MFRQVHVNANKRKEKFRLYVFTAENDDVQKKESVVLKLAPLKCCLFSYASLFFMSLLHSNNVF